MTRLLIALTLAALTACGGYTQRTLGERVTQNVTIEQHREAFCDAIGRPDLKSIRIPIEVSNHLPATRLAECQAVFEGGTVVLDRSAIYLNADNWSRLGDADREQVIWHELAHCLLGMREHQEGVPSYLNAKLPVRPADVAKANFLEWVSHAASTITSVML
jgi:hypothetical protein